MNEAEQAIMVRDWSSAQMGARSKGASYLRDMVERQTRKAFGPQFDRNHDALVTALLEMDETVVKGRFIFQGCAALASFFRKLFARAFTKIIVPDLGVEQFPVNEPEEFGFISLWENADEDPSSILNRNPEGGGAKLDVHKSGARNAIHAHVAIGKLLGIEGPKAYLQFLSGMLIYVKTKFCSDLPDMEKGEMTLYVEVHRARINGIATQSFDKTAPREWATLSEKELGEFVACYFRVPKPTSEQWKTLLFLHMRSLAGTTQPTKYLLGSLRMQYLSSLLRASKDLQTTLDPLTEADADRCLGALDEWIGWLVAQACGIDHCKMHIGGLKDPFGAVSPISVGPISISLEALANFGIETGRQVPDRPALESVLTHVAEKKPKPAKVLRFLNDILDGGAK